MKRIRSLLAAVVTLVLLCSVLPSASADIIYPAPSSVEAGTYLNHLVATVQTDAALSYVPGALPPGVEFVSEQGLDGLNVFLRGTPMQAGVYNCALTIGDGSALCPLTVTPATPVVSSTGDVSCFPGESVQIAVNAYVGDGGALSYQWYYSNYSNNAFGTVIPGETQPVCHVGTGYAGVSYYYCVVTNNNNGYTVSTSSPVISVSVSENSISSVTLFALPYKTSYMLGETLDTTGLQLAVQYTNGSVQYVTQGFSVTPSYLTTPGAQPVQVDYQGFQCVFYINVGAQDEIIDSVYVLTLPAKIRYTVGETLDPTGLTLRAYSSLGYRDLDSGFTCSPTFLSTLGEQTITVTVGDKTCTFTVTVEEAEHPVSLVVEKMPDKTVYTVGESLNIAGLVLRQISSRQNSETIYSGFTCYPTLLSTVGRQEITVSYGSLTTRFTVTVTEVFAAPSPSVTPYASATAAPLPSSVPTAAPSSLPLPSSSPVIRTSHSSHQSNLGRSLIAVIVVTALVALAVLGIYVYIMNRGGFEAAGERLSNLFRGKGKNNRKKK